MSADAVPRRSNSRSPLAGIELANSVRAALDLARHRTGPNGVVTTGAVVATLEECDGHGRWERVWSRTGFVGGFVLAGVGDPDEPPLMEAPTDSHWSGVALSPALAACLALLEDLSAEFELRPIPAGALALALMCEPTATTVRTIAADGTSQDEILEIIQDELLGTELEGFDDWLAARWTAGRSPAERAVRRARADAFTDDRSPDDIDLMTGLTTELTELDGKPFPATLVLRQILDDAAAPARRLPTRPLTDVIASAGPNPDEWSLMAATVTTPSPACRAILDVIGMTGPGVAADALVTQDERAGRRWPARGAALAATIANTIVMLVVAGLIVAHALGPGHWRELFVVPLAFLGPTAPPAVPLVVAVVLGVVTTPAVAAVQLLRLILDQFQVRLERRRVLAHTGVTLSYRECRRHLVRRNRPGPQAAAALWRAPTRLSRLEARTTADRR